MNPPTVLVTGAAGYVGSVLVDLLLRSRFRVVAVDNLMHDNAHAVLCHLGKPGFEFHELDVCRDEPAVLRLAAGADAVVPLAALVGAPACDRWPVLATLVNEMAVGKLAARLGRAQRLVYPNTNSGYGSAGGDRPCTEGDPLTPVSHYGRTKCAAEAAALAHPNAAVLRLATVFGASPRMRLDLLVNDFTERLLRAARLRASGAPRGTRDLLLVVYEPHFRRNFVGVRDVARAFLLMLSDHRLRGVYNLGLPSANLTKLGLAHRVCDTLGLPRDFVAVGEGRDPDQRDYLVSNDKILATGFEFKQDLAGGVGEVRAVCELFRPEQLAGMRNA